MHVFETERLMVRKFSTADAEDFFRFNSDPEVMRYIRPIKTREECDTFLRENLNFYQEGSCLGRWFVGEKTTARFAGTFSLMYLEGEADFHIGYGLVPEAQGKGYATELVKGGMHYFFANTCYATLFAITQPENTASQKVLVKTGFALKGRIIQHGEELDLFHRTRESYGLQYPVQL